MKNMSTKKMAILGLLCAMATVVGVLVRIPLVPAVSFMTFDGKDVIIGLAGFLFGPLSALVVTLISCSIELLFHGGTFVDWFMDVLSSATFVCTAAFIYKRIHTRNGAFIGLISGCAANIAMMLLWNYIMDPIYFGMPREAVVAMLPPIALFNFLKGAIGSAILLVVYKPISNALHKSGLLKARDEEHISDKKGLAAAGTVMLVTAAVLGLCYVHLV